MSSKLLKGKPIADSIKRELSGEIERLKSTYNIAPVLASIQVGENPASLVYLKSQRKSCQELEIKFSEHKLSENITEGKLIDFIGSLNQNKDITGVIIQLPLPIHLDAKKMISCLDPQKDVEGMHPQNLGNLLLGRPKLVPCTPQAIVTLIKSTDINLYGKEVVVVGHSEIVGKPLSLLFLNEFATVTVCHIGTSQAGNLKEHVETAEILVVAVGKAELIKGRWIKKKAIVVDVGINKVGNRIVGDVEFDNASKRASFITPVPGGVGPLTTAMLMKNVVEAFKSQRQV